MNDRPLNSYYYTPHCSNYVVHWASLWTPFPNKKTGKKGTCVCASWAFLSLHFPKLAAPIKCNFVAFLQMLEGTHSPPQPSRQGKWLASLVPFSCACRNPLRLWSLSLGSQEFSDLRVAPIGITPPPSPITLCTPAGPRLVERAEWAPAIHPPHHSPRRVAIQTPVEGGGGSLQGRGLEPWALVGGTWCPPHPSLGSH